MVQENRKIGHYMLKIEDKSSCDIHTVPVRFIGYINEDECEAILNIEDSGRKIITAEGTDIYGEHAIGKRFVIVIKESSKAFGNKESPAVWISPIIYAIVYEKQQKIFLCKEKKTDLRFKFEEVYRKTA